MRISAQTYAVTVCLHIAHNHHQQKKTQDSLTPAYAKLA